MSNSTPPIELIKLSPQMDSILNLLANSVWPSNILAALIGLPSAALYLLELFILAKHWNRFKSSFFVLFIFRAIIALLNMSLNYVNQRFCKLGLFLSFYQSLPGCILSIAYFFIYFPFHVENLANFFLLLNRFCSVAFLTQYEIIWSIPLTLGCLLFSTILPLPFTLHILQYQVYAYVQNQSFVLSYTIPDNLQNFIKNVPFPFNYIYKSNNLSAAVSSILFMFICLLLNILTIFGYKKHQNRQQMMTRKEKLERKMTVYALLTLFGQLAMSIYMLLWYMVSSYWKPNFDKYTYDLTNLALQNQSPWVNDFSTIALPAWLMLFANARIQAAIKAMVHDSFLCEFFHRWGLLKEKSQIGLTVTVNPNFGGGAGWTQNQVRFPTAPPKMMNIQQRTLNTID